MKYLADTNILCQQDTDPKVRNWVMQHFLAIGVSSITMAEPTINPSRVKR